jgi:hypothetical protein
VALKKMPYRTVESLIRDYMAEPEEEHTAELIKELATARARGYLTKSELEKICRWKSPRAIRHIRSNTSKSVQSRTRTALETRSEHGKLEQLTCLSGVSVPMASAILMLLKPGRYGVIDIRVWQILYRFGTVTSNRRGMHFSWKNWFQFQMIVRHFARKLSVTPRDVERALFFAHRHYQEGPLYPKAIPT